MPCSKLRPGSASQSAYLVFITDVSSCIPLKFSSSTDQELWRGGVTATRILLCGAASYGNCHQESQSPDQALTLLQWRYQCTEDSHFSHTPWQFDLMRHNALCKMTLLALPLHPCPAFPSRDSYSLISRCHYLGLLAWLSSCAQGQKLHALLFRYL